MPIRKHGQRKVKPSRKNRNAVIIGLNTLDEEAFQWVALALMEKVWPDGLGGFKDRATIEKVKAAAKEYLEREEG